MLTFKKILCPIDFSESSNLALDEAIWWMASYEAENNHSRHSELCVMHVLPAAYAADGDVMLRSSDFEEREEAHKKLRNLITSRVPHDVQQCLRGEVLRGNPGEEITHYAKTSGYDLIAIGTHGLTGWRHMVLGSVTEAVVLLLANPDE